MKIVLSDCLTAITFPCDQPKLFIRECMEGILTKNDEPVAALRVHIFVLDSIG